MRVNMSVCDLLKQSLLMERFLNICKRISELDRTQRYLFQNNLGVFGVCLGLEISTVASALQRFPSSPTHFKWHDLIKHFFTFNCMPRPQGIICWVALSGLEWGWKDMSI